MPNKRKSPKYFLILVSFGLLCLGLALIVNSWFFQQFPMGYFFNADALHLPALYRDILLQHGNFSDWWLPRAPFIFPDWLIYFIANSIFSKIYFALIMTACLQIILTFLLTTLLGCQLLPRSTAIFCAGLSIFTLCWLALSHDTFRYMLITVFHYGSFLNLLLTLWLMVNLLYNPPGHRHHRGWVIALFIITSCAELSDNLYIGQTILPLIATLFWLAYTRTLKWKIVARYTIILLFSVIFSRILFHLFIPHPISSGIHLSFLVLLDNLRNDTQLIKQFMTTEPLIAILCSGGWLMLLTLFAYQNIKKIHWNITQNFYLTFTCTIFFGLTLIKLLAVSAAPDRYFIPIFFLPILALPILGYFLLKNKKLLTRVTLIVLGIFLYQINQQLSFSWSHGHFQSDYYPKEIQCLDQVFQQHHLHHGISQYWDATYFSLLAKNSVEIASVSNTLNNYYWASTKRWYHAGYDFALINNQTNIIDDTQLNETWLRKINGNPIFTKQCGHLHILVYPTNYLHTQYFYGQTTPRQYTWSACQLPSTMPNSSTLHCARNNYGQQGYLTTGPHVKLNTGKYQIEWVYQSTASKTTPVATFEIVARDESHLDKQYLGQYTLMGTAGKRNIFHRSLNVTPMLNGYLFELRIAANGKNLIIYHLKLIKK